MDDYKQIFKRQSFHIFKNAEMITEDDITKLKFFVML